MEASRGESGVGSGAGGHRPKRIRAFLALDPPAATIAAVAAWQRRALGEGLRALGPDGLHLTLVFLGECDPAEIERAASALHGVAQASGPIAVELAPGPIALPPRRPRVVALEATSTAAVRLQEALRAELAAVDVSVVERRRYRPHLSVARVRGHPSRRGAEAAVAGLASFGGPGGHTFDAVRVALYRSELRSQGARYSLLADVELPRGSGG
jgi:2'-5' RNA ligase